MKSSFSRAGKVVVCQIAGVLELEVRSIRNMMGFYSKNRLFGLLLFLLFMSEGGWSGSPAANFPASRVL
jgi:hypothetical protein